MAVAYQSSQTNSANGSGVSIAITKPVGTAVGDLLIASIAYQNSISAFPSGWTLLTTQGNNSGNLAIYYIVATSTEVAATNFTWSSPDHVIAGGVSRITGQQGTPLAVFAKDQDAGSATATPSYAASVTPNDTNSLLLFMIGTMGSGTSPATTSTYAITTSNPSWTEAYDVGGGNPGGGNVQTALAYATRPQVTATGNATAVISAGRNSSGIMVVVRPLFTSAPTETVTMTDTRSYLLAIIITEIVSMIETLSSFKSRLWRKTNKPSTTWRKYDK